MAEFSEETETGRSLPLRGIFWLGFLLGGLTGLGAGAAGSDSTWRVAGFAVFAACCLVIALLIGRKIPKRVTVSEPGPEDQIAGNTEGD